MEPLMKEKEGRSPGADAGPYQAPTNRERAVAALEPVLVPIWPDGAKAIGVGRSLMFELVGTGKIATVKCGRKRLVAPDELRAFAARLASAA